MIPERLSRLAALALVVLLILALPLLVSLFGSLGAGDAGRGQTATALADVALLATGTAQATTRSGKTADALAAVTASAGTQIAANQTVAAQNAGTEAAGTGVAATQTVAAQTAAVSAATELAASQTAGAQNAVGTALAATLAALTAQSPQGAPPLVTPPTAPGKTGCVGPATPEPLWVDPVVSPTNLLTQKIRVTLGRGREITIATDAGSVTVPGNFSVGTAVEIEVPLLPNATNNVTVTGRVEYAPGCFYTLQTRLDRNGQPLVIVQTNGASGPPTPQTPPPTVVVTAPPPGTVYMKPFSQVFALNRETPNTSEPLWLYQKADATPFRLLAQEGAFGHLQSPDGALNFWTLTANYGTTPATPPAFDTSVAGKTVQLATNHVFACEAGEGAPLVLGACAEIQNVSTAQVVQKAQVETSVLYEVRLNGKAYWVSGNALKSD